MEFRLAALLGRTVAEVRQLPVSEYRGWLRYWNEEPWGPWRDNAHAGVIASVLANIHRKKGAPAFKYDQFLLKNERFAKEDEMAALPAKLRAMARPRAERDAEMKAKRMEKKQRGKKRG